MKDFFRPKDIKLDDIKKACEMAAGTDHPMEVQMCIINEEFRRGFYFISKYRRSVTIFGSARSCNDDIEYEKARRIAKQIVQETGYVVVTGGGPGVMEAANRGAYDGNGISLGINIRIPTEQTTNPWVTDSITFENFFSRKVILAYGSEAYLVFPGGFGTLDELFGVLTLRQTLKISPAPIILIGKKYWDNFMPAFEMLADDGYINRKDLELFKITDDEEEILEIVKNSPERIA